MNAPRECPTVVTWVAPYLWIAVLTAERTCLAVLEMPFQVSKTLKGWFRWDIWLTWLVHLQSRCELQLRNWHQGREWRLTIPKECQRLWQGLRYTQHRIILCWAFCWKTVLGIHWHSRSIGSLMSDDDSRLRWREANIPFIANDRSSLMAYRKIRTE